MQNTDSGRKLVSKEDSRQAKTTRVNIGMVFEKLQIWDLRGSEIKVATFLLDQ